MQVNKQINENILVLKKQSDAKILFSSLNLWNKFKYSLLTGFLGIGMIALSLSTFSFRYFSKIGVIKIDCDRLKNTEVNCKILRSGASKFSQNNSVKIKGILKADLYVSTTKNLNSFKVVFTVIKSFQKDDLFTYNFDYQDECKSTFESINNFLYSKKVSFSNSYDRYSYDNSFYNNFLFFLFVFLLLFGLWNLIIAISLPFYYEKLLLNKLEMQLTYTNRALFDVKVKQYAFTDITKVDLLPNSLDKNSSISFVPRLTVNYEDEYILGDIKDHQTALEFVNNLNKFIGLPEEDAVRKSEDESC
ncbi:hypothetical protein APA_82 [Pseudanabaena sp. lw0831]|uniref:hypothetical protein n=1 Tax=Pseudanabaena sp. lw0831 TaxID=1357935 RepID=UPI00191622D8|nr:hypothetical protein [Pseudanabaena sp. lw0831]GBO52413.1 hypothetical protein APA_82 [Pseudanabaena sp. lw0831]